MSLHNGIYSCLEILRKITIRLKTKINIKEVFFFFVFFKAKLFYKCKMQLNNTWYVDMIKIWFWRKEIRYTLVFIYISYFTNSCLIKNRKINTTIFKKINMHKILRWGGGAFMYKRIIFYFVLKANEIMFLNSGIYSYLEVLRNFTVPLKLKGD